MMRVDRFEPGLRGLRDRLLYIRGSFRRIFNVKEQDLGDRRVSSGEALQLW